MLAKKKKKLIKLLKKLYLKTVPLKIIAVKMSFLQNYFLGFFLNLIFPKFAFSIRHTTLTRAAHILEGRNFFSKIIDFKKV